LHPYTETDNAIPSQGNSPHIDNVGRSNILPLEKMTGAPLQSPTGVDEAAELAMKDQRRMEDLQILRKRKESLLSVAGNPKGVHPVVNTLGGEVSSSCQPNVPSTMDVKILATPHVCLNAKLPGNDGDRSSKRMKVNPADTVISSEHGTRAALLAANSSKEWSFAKSSNAVVQILDNTVGRDIPAGGVDTTIKDGGLDNKSTEEALLSLSSIPVSGAAPVVNAWDNLDDVEFVEALELVEASLS
jgi:hypothetical protein